MTVVLLCIAYYLAVTAHSLVFAPATTFRIESIRKFEGARCILIHALESSRLLSVYSSVHH